MSGSEDSQNVGSKAQTFQDSKLEGSSSCNGANIAEDLGSSDSQALKVFEPSDQATHDDEAGVSEDEIAIDRPKFPSEFEFPSPNYNKVCKYFFLVADNIQSKLIDGMTSKLRSDLMKVFAIAGLHKKYGYEPHYADPFDRAYMLYESGCRVMFYRSMFECGFTLPLHPFFGATLKEFGIAASQLMPNGWRILISYFMICCYRRWVPSVDVLLAVYKIARYGNWYNLQCKVRKSPIITPTGHHDWKNKFFSIQLTSSIKRFDCPTV